MRFKSKPDNIQLILVIVISWGAVTYQTTIAQHSVARQWNEELLEAVRNDFARPTVHARNLFHLSVSMYDAWAVYDSVADPYLLGNTKGNFYAKFHGVENPANLKEARREAISYAAYRLLKHRFKYSPGAEIIYSRIDSLMQVLGYNPEFTSTDYSSNSPAALGNYMGEQMIEFGLQDGAKELFDYGNESYLPVNDPLELNESGNNTLTAPNRWQPLSFETFIDQSGNVFPGQTPEFLGAEWGHVLPFALKEKNKTVYERNGYEYTVYHDPGPPPRIDTLNSKETELFLWSFTRIPIWASQHDPEDEVLIDISPASMGNMNQPPESFQEHPDYYDFAEGGIDNFGRNLNPATGEPYEPQIVPRGDYTRVISEYWADGPASETPPGHWFTILNDVADHPGLVKLFRGNGEILDDLEWDVKVYFMLGGAMHDAAISAWSVKGWYDYVRPISVLRWMADQGQRSDPEKPSFNKWGLPLIENFIEIVKPGDPLSGDSDENVGKIKFFTWRGHNYIGNPETDRAGVGWILAEDWWPYQQPTFVTPPFAGYVSGHSTFSHAAAKVLGLFTGDEYFPGGMGTFLARKDEYLEFENGPDSDIELQWATYKDAAFQSAISRIWGGIHPTIDDLPGRKIGEKVGIDAFYEAVDYFTGISTSVRLADDQPMIPGTWKLHQNYPNPFNPSTTISFQVPVKSKVVLTIFDITGRKVSTVLSGMISSGDHTITWNANNLASGIYVYKLEAHPMAGNISAIYTKTKKLTLVK